MTDGWSPDWRLSVECGFSNHAYIKIVPIQPCLATPAKRPCGPLQAFSSS